jgi:hypothetical protein
VTSESRKHRPWTVMIYMAGDNGTIFDTKYGPLKLMAEMTAAGYADLLEMGSVGTTDNVAVVCLFDTPDGTYEIQVRKGRGFADSIVRSLQEINTGDPVELRDFIVRSVAAHPADHYLLVIWNHGTGWLDVDHYAVTRALGDDGKSHGPIFRTTPSRAIEGQRTRPIAYDDSSKDFLDTQDLRKALGEAQAATGRRLDLVGMDACLMAMIEGARELAPFADYFIASQEVEPLDGWPYRPILEMLDRHPGLPPVELAGAIVGEYARRYGGATRLGEEIITQSALALASTAVTEVLCGRLVHEVLGRADAALLGIVRDARKQAQAFQDRSYRDLGDFADRLAQKTEWTGYTAVTAAAKALRDHLRSRGPEGPVLRVGFRSAYQRATGMSVYLPESFRAGERGRRLAIYRQLRFPQATGWDRLLEWLHAEPRANAVQPVFRGDEFRRDRAVQTLLDVSHIIAAQRDWLDDMTRRQVAAVIVKHGPAIATLNGSSALNSVVALLDGLWSLRSSLPGAATSAMQAGQGMTARFVAQIDPDQRQIVLDALLGIADFRFFRDPVSTAREVSQLVAGHQERLATDERAAWLALDAAYRQGGDPVAYLRAVEEVLGGQVATLRDRLTRDKVWRPERYGVPEPPGARSREEDSQPALDSPVLTRYANVHFPAAVLITQQMVPLVLHIACQHEVRSQIRVGQGCMTLSPGELTVLLNAEGFRVAESIGGRVTPENAAIRTLKVEADRDCEPLVFFLSPLSVGRKCIWVDIYQFDRLIAGLSFEVAIVEEPEALGILARVAPASVPVESALQDRAAAPPDLELRVMLSADQRTLFYMLHSSRRPDYHFKPVGSVKLAVEPLKILAPVFDRMGGLARHSVGSGTIEDATTAVRELTDIGNNLYRDLFPEPLKREYRKFRETYRGGSLLITSDEPWIPWEMVQPFESDEDGNVLYDDPPLCETFQVSRWLAGRGAPDQVTVQRGVWVAPLDNLQAAQEESDYFAALHRRYWEVSFCGPLTRLAEVEQRFSAGDTHLFHFACHGSFEADNPDESKLRLAGDFLRPSQISGVKQSGLQRARPLVFLNACHSGRVGAGLTRIGGWAQRFVECGASAFIGSLWEISDDLAIRFAVEFYNRLWGLSGHSPQPLGQAFSEARRVIKAADPADPTWLAYVLYGDPEARVLLGTGPRDVGLEVASPGAPRDDLAVAAVDRP